MHLANLIKALIFEPDPTVLNSISLRLYKYLAFQKLHFYKFFLKAYFTVIWSFPSGAIQSVCTDSPKPAAKFVELFVTIRLQTHFALLTRTNRLLRAENRLQMRFLQNLTSTPRLKLVQNV